MKNSQICGDWTTHAWATNGSQKKSKGKFKKSTSIAIAISILDINGNIAHQNLRTLAETVLRGNFITINAYMKRRDNLTLNLKKMEKGK